MRLDGLDKQIVAHLVLDARASFAGIGAEIGLSAPAVKRRVDRLRAAGVIRGFHARVDPHALGWTTEALVQITCAPRTSPGQLLACLRGHPEVIGADSVAGDTDAVLRITATDVRHLEEVLDRLRDEPLVLGTRTTIVPSRLLEHAGGGPFGPPPVGTD
ncbi:Lrp/AsnC family transcriptional regulator [Embleya sp. NPDC020886]|uniref:Lrp/AsnC family transcriptional regulator n=1 Tax=Embleya sp. NPDC020886 TaxID=3363980 RepID=UPI00378D8D61